MDGSGRIYAKGQKLRFEVSGGGRDVTILADTKGGRSTMLMPQQKLAMDMPQAMADQQVMSGCTTQEVDACFKKKGYRKVGSETVDGHPCSIFEGKETHGGITTHQKVWRPTDLKEVFMLKSVTRLENGTEVISQVKDVKLGRLEDSLFKVPEGYRRMAMPNLKGAAPAGK